MSSLVYSVKQKSEITKEGVVNISVIQTGGEAWPVVV